MLRYKRILKEIFIVRTPIKLQAAILECSEAAVHSHPFSKISPGNTGVRVFLLVKLQTDCSEKWLYTKITLPRMFSWKSSNWTVQKQLPKIIHFRTFLQKILVIESFFWSNYRLVVQSSDYILKWLNQERFLGNLPIGLLSIAIHFQTFLKKIPVVECFFWSNYSLAVQNSDCILKWLHQ